MVGRIVSIGLAAGLALVLTACADADIPIAEPSTPPETWAAAGFDSYEMTVSRVCFCPVEYVGPFTVTVENGEVASVTREGKDVDLDDDTLTEVPLTVEQLFDAVDRYEESADDVRVTYDDELGYPVTIAVDQIANAIDDEVTFQVDDLHAA